MYSAYGLRIKTSEPAVGFLPLADDAPPDVWVEFGFLPAEVVASDSRRELIFQSETLVSFLVRDVEEYFEIRYVDGPEFVLSTDGSHVWCAWPDPLTLEDVCVYLLGPILGLVQQLMGRTLLHASAVVIDGFAVALLGGPGAGKSTTAGMFSSIGYPVLSDDALPLLRSSGSIIAQPGYPLLRLWPESASILRKDHKTLRRMAPTVDKFYLDLLADERRFESVAKPLGAIYILADRSEAAKVPCVESIGSADAMLSLIANPYPGYLYREARRGADLLFFGEMLNSGTVRVRKVIPHTDPGRLTELCQLICEDFRSRE